MSILCKFTNGLLLIFVVSPTVMGQITGGLPPVQEKIISKKQEATKKSHVEQFKAAPNQYLLDLHSLDYQKRVSVISSEIGVTIPLIESTISDYFSSHTPLHSGEAGLSESSQTWWISGESGYIVFQNFANKSINGITVAIYEGRCNIRNNARFRKITFSRDAKPYETIASRFRFPSDMEKITRCIDIYDLNYIN